MKEWTINEFVAECEELMRNPYTYDINRMPEGICNGHEVKFHPLQWGSVVIDHCIQNLGIMNDRYPDGSIGHCIDGKNFNSLEYVRYLLERPLKSKEPPLDEFGRMPYGYVNGEPVYTAEDFRYKARGFGPIQTDEELMAYAEKVTLGWYDAGHHHSFIGFYLSDYALSEPYRSLTHSEFARLKELQKIAREEHKRAEEAREWHYVRTIYWADNSVEEIWEDKDGVQKTVMIEGPHGDAC